MIATVLIGVTMMMSNVPGDCGKTTERSFLMLNDRSIEIVDGAAVIGHWPVLREWDPVKETSVHVVDGQRFVIDKDFWRMVEANGARHSAKSDVAIDAKGRLSYRAKPVEIGLALRHVETALRWRDHVVALATAADPQKSTIKGSIWYLCWFNEKTLKGSCRDVASGSTPPLRIYSK